MNTNLSFQEKIRKPLLNIIKFNKFTGLHKIYQAVVTPYSRFSLFDSPFLKSLQIDFVIDIGANSGEFIILSKNAFPSSPILAFEPISNEYNKIRNAFESDKSIEIVNKALGGQTGDAEIFVGDFSPSSSIVKPERENYKVEKIKLDVLDNYLASFKNNSNVFCKIDVEGYELEVLKGATESLKKIKYLYLECRTDNDLGCSFDEIYAFLNPLGFKYKGNYDSTFKENGELSHFDAFFVHKNL